MPLLEGSFTWSETVPKKERVYYVVLIGLCALMAYLFFYESIQQEISKLDGKIERSTEQEESLSARIQELEKQIEESGESTARRQSAEDLTSHPRFAPLLSGEVKDSFTVAREAMNALTSKDALQDMELDEFRMDNIEDKGSYQRIGISLQLTGSYDQVVRYLREMENLPMLLRFDNVGIIVDPDHRQLLRAKVVGAVYVVKDPGSNGNSNNESEEA